MSKDEKYIEMQTLVVEAAAKLQEALIMATENDFLDEKPVVRDARDVVFAAKDRIAKLRFQRM